MTAWVSAAILGARVALSRMRGRAALLIAAGAVGFATLAAFAERKGSVGQAASRALQGPGFGLAIPIATLALVALGLAGTRLDASVDSIAAMGGNRRAAAVGSLLGTALVASVLGLLTAATMTVVAHGSADPSSMGDALTSGWVGALTAFAYVFLYGAGSSFGKRGGGRLVVFVADLFIGPMVGTTAALFPRAHALNLLGSTPVLDLPQRGSAMALAGLAILFATVCALRTRP